MTDDKITLPPIAVEPEDKSGGGTPFAQWRFLGQANPFEDYLNKKRTDLAMGNLTDFELANEVFLRPEVSTLTAAKERIRWLSLELLEATDNLVAHRNTITLVQGDDYERGGHGGSTKCRTWIIYVNGVPYRELMEGSQQDDYCNEGYMDRHINSILSTLEKCLGTKTVRCQLKGRKVLIHNRRNKKD